MQTSNGTFPDTLAATVQSTALTTRFLASARYSYATHVDSIFVNNCTGCHGASGGLTFTTSNPSANRAALVLTSNCGGLPRVSVAGGTTGVDNSIVLLYLVAGASPPCAFSHIEPSGWASRLALIEAWIRNSAPSN
jgi:hypothetical protein